MNNKSTYLSGILATLIIGALLQWYFCCNCSAEKKPEKAHVKNTITKPAVSAIPFAFKDGNLSIKSQDNLNFFKSEHAVVQPVSEHLTSCLQELASYFKNNPNKTLKITGWYIEAENNSSNYDNLGLARAWAIKNHLSELGFPKHQMEVNGKVNNTLKANVEQLFFGPYAFETLTKKEDNSELLKLKKAAQRHTVLVHFLPGRFSKTVTAQEKSRLRDVANYLNASETSSCTIIGHTDSVGSEQSNLVLGKERAEFAKKELVKLKVSPKKIKTLSRGESSPIAANATKNGKAKNRRTEIQLN